MSTLLEFVTWKEKKSTKNKLHNDSDDNNNTRQKQPFLNLDLILKSCAHAARSALDGISGVAGLDEDKGGEMNTIAFPRIKGGKPFDYHQDWYGEMLSEIGQPLGQPYRRVLGDRIGR